MRSISSTELPALEFSKSIEKQQYHSQENKIGWMRVLTDAPGASFDIVIKDGLGRVKAQRLNCSSDTNEFGELVNIPTMVGEKLDVEVLNLKGADKATVFLN